MGSDSFARNIWHRTVTWLIHTATSAFREAEGSMHRTCQSCSSIRKDITKHIASNHYIKLFGDEQAAVAALIN